MTLETKSGFQLDESSEDISTNPTGSTPFTEVAAAQLSRRRLLQGSLAVADATAAGGKTITISSDYEYQVLTPWGTPINPDSGIAPYEGDPDSRPSSEDQEQMVGIGHDGMWFFPSNLPVLSPEVIC